MIRISLTLTAYLAMPASAIADSLLLNCQLVKGSGFNMMSAYAKPPKDLQDQFIRDAMELGIIGLFIEPPTTWEVNLSANTVVSPEESHKVLNVTSTSASKIEAYSRFGAGFSLNRINSRLEYSVQIGAANAASWKKAHGGTIPQTLGYSYSCLPVQGLGVTGPGAMRP